MANLFEKYFKNHIKKAEKSTKIDKKSLPKSTVDIVRKKHPKN